MTQQTFCPKHGTLEDVDCEEVTVACPPRVPLDPTKHVILSCGPCDRTRVIPVGQIMRGKVQSGGMCVLGECAASVVLPAPISAENGERIIAAVEKAHAKGVTDGINQAAKPRATKPNK